MTECNSTSTQAGFSFFRPQQVIVTLNEGAICELIVMPVFYSSAAGRSSGARPRPAGRQRVRLPSAVRLLRRLRHRVPIARKSFAHGAAGTMRLPSSVWQRARRRPHHESESYALTRRSPDLLRSLALVRRFH